ncbi:MAG: aldo/keto reductase [Leptothrix sp. (in: Bacteria)]|nr:aldo/keto reductase [Leptothrix sp. (in: b-proteobacteria)]
MPCPEVSFPSGELRPALGLGTWRFGEQPGRRSAEVASLRLALEMGWRLVDTAEMYGDGGAETVTGQALAEAQRAGVPRNELFVVSKVLPDHAGARALQAACEASLCRLQLDSLDLFLLHWRGGVPLAETVRGFEQLQRRGLIRLWGVSNFDLDDMRELGAVPGGRACATNQVHYSLGQRGVEYDLLPWLRVQQMPLMAYSPFDQGELVNHPRLRPLAERHRARPAQVALAWLLRQPGVMAIPKAGNALHLRHNWAAQQLRLGADDLAELDRHFAPPRKRQPLAVR